MPRSDGKPKKDGRATPASLGPYVLAEAERARGLFAIHPARHAKLGHAAVVTTVAPSIAARADLTQRLEEHAELLASLGHNAVFGLLEVVHDGDRVGVVSAAPEGTSLRALIDGLGGGALTLEEGVAMGVMVARAVALLHAKGIAHLALAPEHVFIAPSGTVKLGALFDARAVTGRGVEAREAETVRESGPDARYRSPERIGGASPALESDVFSVGAMTFELLTGRVPWSDGGSPAATARRVLTESVPSLGLTGASVALEQSVARALEKQPSLRYETAARFADELEALLAGDVVVDCVPRDLLARASRAQPGPRDERARLPRVLELALRLAVVLAAMIVVMVVASLGGDAPARRGGASPAMSAGVKVLARPWAEVLIDGKLVDTTPIGRPIPVDPGRHEIVLRHPNAPEERRTFDVGAGQTHLIDVDMAVVRVVDAGVDASP